MSVLLIALHVIACFGLIVIVLLQQGKGANMGAAFGGSSQTLFGSSGASPFFSRLTTGVAIVFMITSLALAFFFGPKSVGPSLVKPTSAPVSAPAQPAGAPAETQAPAAKDSPAAPAAPAPQPGAEKK